MEDASLQATDESLPFVIECDVSDVSISPTHQSGRPITLISKLQSKSELQYSTVEKKAAAIIETV